jgi:hypothetical protein
MRTACLVFIVSLCLSVTAQADPLCGEVLKFMQRPQIATQFMNGEVFYGHDEASCATWYPGNNYAYGTSWMADDFADNYSRCVSHVQWWGSYTAGVPGSVQRFLVEFLDDVAVGPNQLFSRPGNVLSAQIVDFGMLSRGSGTYIEQLVTGSNPQEPVYKYNAELAVPFHQQANTVYWLKIVALPIDPSVIWGWHDRDYTVQDPLASPAVLPGERQVGAYLPGTPEQVKIFHFQDDAVRGNFIEVQFSSDNKTIVNLQENTPAAQPQNYINFIDGPGPQTQNNWPGIGAFSKDLAFALYYSRMPGDANDDCKVSFADYLVLEANFGKTNVGWEGCDFNCDAKVSFADYLILEANFGKTCCIPEPACICLLAAAALSMRRRHD